MRSRITHRPFSFLSPLCVTVLLTLSPVAGAQEQTPATLSGVPVVQDSGEMVINGQKIILWGIDTLAPDQQCWQGDAAWGCGESSIMALRHYVDGRKVECEIQHYANEEGTPVARCYCMKGEAKHDIGARLVSQGWAMERGATSGGAYFKEEQEAQENKRGIWSGRFQSAQDWREGVQRYYGDPPEEPPFQGQ